MLPFLYFTNMLAPIRESNAPNPQLPEPVPRLECALLWPTHDLGHRTAVA